MPEHLTLYWTTGKSRASRPLWLYYELEAAYEGRATRRPLPELKVEAIDRATFRQQKPEEFLRLNPNGKVKEEELWKNGKIPVVDKVSSVVLL